MLRALRFAAPLLSVALVSSIASAQGGTDPATTPAPAPAGYPPAPAAPVAAAPAPAPAPVTTTTTTTTDGGTDFSKIVGRIGIGYMGQYDVPIGQAGQAGANATRSVPTQMIGVRYFFSERFGIDVGFGLGVLSGSTKVGAASTDNPSTLGVSLKAGVPIVIASSSHYSFFFEPQALFGFAGETIKSLTPTTQADIKNSGMRFTLGAAAGALVQFGFIGIPQLTLDATVGIAIPDIQSRTTESGAPTAVTKTTSSSTLITTYTGHQPWNIFHTNVAAIYHF